MTTMTFIGGTTAQRRLVTTAHTTAIDLVWAAQRAAEAGAPAFTTWFGTASRAAVTTTLIGLDVALGRSTLVCDLTAPTPCAADQELLFSLKENAADRQLLVPSGAVLLAAADPAVARRAALSLVHLAAVATRMTDLAMAADRTGARFLARWRPDTAATAPRNYLYFADDVTPAPR